MASMAEQIADKTQGPIRTFGPSKAPPKLYLTPAKAQFLGGTQYVVRKKAAELRKPMQLERFIALCAQHLKKPVNKRDTRKQVVKRAINSLIGRGIFPANVHYGYIRPFEPAQLEQGTTQSR